MRSTLLILTAALALSACSTSPRMDRQFGSSLRLARAQQTLNPHAHLNRSPVNGLDAQAAKAAYDSYQRSYAQPDTQSGGAMLGGVGTGNR